MPNSVIGGPAGLRAKFLPRGQSLPDAVWQSRHRGILWLLWGHVPFVFVLALVRDVGVAHASIEAAVVASLATMAEMARHHRRLSTVVTSIGLMTASAVMVHLTDGLIEMHFHYFVMVGVVTLYQDWRPFLTAIGYVVLQHGVAGAVSPEAVYNHPAAIADPWTWAGIHGLFIFGMSIAGVITWRLNETLLEATLDRQHRMAEAQELAQIGSWEFDPHTGALQWSDEMYRLYQVDPSVPPDRALVTSRVHPDDLAAFDADIDQCLSGGSPLSLDYRVVLPDGTQRWMHRRGEVTARDDHGPTRLAGTVQDVTQRRQSEEVVRQHEAELRSTLALLSASLDSTADGLLVVGLDGKVTVHNARFTDMWGIDPELLDAGDDAEVRRAMWALVDEPDDVDRRTTELYERREDEGNDTLRLRDGRIFERFSVPQRLDGAVVGRVWSFRDVTARTRLEEELAHRAFHDSLTGLANQALFRDRLHHGLSRLERTGGRMAVLMLDLDDFKTVNDSLGHGAGDDLLMAVTDRLRGCVRTSDTAARLGGDEFAILVEDCGHTEALTVADKIVAVLDRPFVVGGREVFVSGSVGVAIGEAGATPQQLIRNADLAMYRAKQRGRGRREVYEPEMHIAALERLELEADLRRAIERGELVLHYQPIVDLHSSRIAGVEALVRWQHPERGLVPPDKFIPLAEQSGLIDDLGRWVMLTAASDIADLHRQVPGATGVRLSVNVSPVQLRSDEILVDVESVLVRSRLPADALTLEVTEGAVMADPEAALGRLAALRRLGVELSVDDFGTGHSSLSYLHRFPLDELKVDRSFVALMSAGGGDSSLVTAIVRLAQSLRLSVVAEGVETPDQLALLRVLGCDRVQGYHLHRPVAIAGLRALLTEHLASVGAVTP